MERKTRGRLELDDGRTFFTDFTIVDIEPTAERVGNQYGTFKVPEMTSIMPGTARVTLEDGSTAEIVHDGGAAGPFPVAFGVNGEFKASGEWWLDPPDQLSSEPDAT